MVEIWKAGKGLAVPDTWVPLIREGRKRIKQILWKKLRRLEYSQETWTALFLKTTLWDYIIVWAQRNRPYLSSSVLSTSVCKNTCIAGSLLSQTNANADKMEN